jgi:sulfane dehydrogenase subunit SoxC
MKVSRRDVLAGAAGVVALGKAAIAQAPPDPSKVRGKPSRALGLRAPTEKPQRQPRGATSSGTPHQDLYGTITPADLHFERHHGGVPEIDPKRYSLLIHGMVSADGVHARRQAGRQPRRPRILLGDTARHPHAAADRGGQQWTARRALRIGASPKATWFLAGTDAGGAQFRLQGVTMR